MKKYIGLVLVAMSGCILTVNAQQSFSYKNPLLPTELRVNDLLGRMTLEEKIAQIRHLHSWDVFDGQILNQEKLDKMCGGIGYGFFEGFPLTAASCRKTFREIQTYMVEKTRWVFPDFRLPNLCMEWCMREQLSTLRISRWGVLSIQNWLTKRLNILQAN